MTAIVSTPNAKHQGAVNDAYKDGRTATANAQGRLLSAGLYVGNATDAGPWTDE